MLCMVAFSGSGAEVDGVTSDECFDSSRTQVPTPLAMIEGCLCPSTLAQLSSLQMPYPRRGGPFMDEESRHERREIKLFNLCRP